MRIEIYNERPYFAEIPYYLWGEVNYDSEGDCKFPTDTQWLHHYVSNRDTGEWIEISGNESTFEITSDTSETIVRTILFLTERCNAKPIDEIPSLPDWDNSAAVTRTKKIRSDFSNPVLKPFDNHYFWGSWKWTGCFAKEFTWVGRMILYALIHADNRAVSLCIYWLRSGPAVPEQSVALRYALSTFTGLEFETDNEYMDWYDKIGINNYPEPDFEAWETEIKNNS